MCYMYNYLQCFKTATSLYQLPLTSVNGLELQQSPRGGALTPHAIAVYRTTKRRVGIVSDLGLIRNDDLSVICGRAINVKTHLGFRHLGSTHSHRGNNAPCGALF